MPSNRESFWNKSIANVHLDIAVAAYTKVPVTWKDYDYIPDVNKLYFIIEGEGYLKVGGREFYPKPGQMCLLPAGVLQSYAAVSDNTFGKYWCHFSAGIGDIPLFRILETPVCAQIAEPELLIEKFEQLIGLYQRADLPSALRANAVLMDIIALFLEQCGDVLLNTNSNASLERMSEVLLYMETHLAETVSVEELSAITHYHPNYFIRIFKNTTGLSPIQYMNRLRMEKARQLLTLSRLSVSEIAGRVGMDLSYFSRMFKEHTGLTPSDYREMQP
jgi:AraC family transcriptional regulator of arabinose operon